MNNWCVVILFLSLFNISFSQTPPGINPNNEFLKMGYLDVSLYGADLTGIEDATLAIQEAVRVARQYQLACYFPSGIYLVSDTINCFLDVVPTPTDPHFNYFSDRRKPVYLVGATKPRPLIKLSDHAVGFDDPLHPKAIFWLWAKNRQTGSIDPNDEQSNIAFNMVIKGFDIDISGHAGAVGIRFAGAQGSTIEDIKIQADGAYAGFHGCVGQGGGTYNIEVHGGRHAFVLDNGNQSKHPVIVGAKFYNQTQEVFKLDPLWTPMTLVGFHIKKSQGNIMLGSPTRAGLSMIDGLIEYTGTSHSNSLFSTVTRGLYLGNIYVKNYNEIFNDTPLNPNEWNWIKEYNYCGTNSKNLIDGVLNTSSNADIEILSNAPSGKSLIEKHIWNDAEFISIENRNDIDFVNVLDSIKMQGSPALGNGVNDDTDRLQWALDNFKKVFLPKGIYIVSKSLTLHSDNQFFGAGKTFSVIRAGNNWNYTNGASMIKTDDNKRLLKHFYKTNRAIRSSAF